MTGRPRPLGTLLGLTAEQWAEATGRSRRTAERWIAGDVVPDLATAAQMAQIAGVTVDAVAGALLPCQPDPNADPEA